MAQIFLTTNLVIDEYLFSGYGDSLSQVIVYRGDKNRSGS